jgi:hypothetical protein
MGEKFLSDQRSVHGRTKSAVRGYQNTLMLFAPTVPIGTSAAVLLRAIATLPVRPLEASYLGPDLMLYEAPVTFEIDRDLCPR